ncbi:MAG TPA: SH3 domain-containing protein [Spirochaetota bacterium]|nr:SH3 domain-containing protein [Spirochaetota bacterium]HOR44612.1 SH3 domain-containing protein [Spirochaetota bacterium]HPK56028.1 SH3 domain-containing protein [Spirochaetota bacterium]
MKKIILYSITLLVSLSSSAETSKFAEVNAKNGLRMREKPDLGSKIINTVPYNEEVQILRESDKTDTFENITDKWVLVRYKNKEGWSFHGFLDRIDSTERFHVGYYQKGKAYLELKESNIENKKLIEYIRIKTEFSNEDSVRYTYPLKNIDYSIVESCINIKKGDKFVLKSVNKSLTAEVSNFIITMDPAGGNIYYYIILDVSPNFFKEDENIIGGKELQKYTASDSYTPPQISNSEKAAIVSIITKNKYSTEFSRYVKYFFNNKTYYMLFMSNSEMNEKSETIIIDENYKSLATIEKDTYTTIKPKAVYDFNRDGNSEILVFHGGYEGGNDAFFIPRKNNKFKIISYTYYGM